VNIDVRDGRVVLTGTVETWREYHAAEENAYEGGALIVSNRLEVKSAEPSAPIKEVPDRMFQFVPKGDSI
jgi:hypothetical protein